VKITDAYKTFHDYTYNIATSGLLQMQVVITYFVTMYTRLSLSMSLNAAEADILAKVTRKLHGCINSYYCTMPMICL